MYCHLLIYALMVQTFRKTLYFKCLFKNLAKYDVDFDYDTDTD